MKDKTKIIFINQVTGYLFIDIINSFAEDIHCELYTGQLDIGHIPLNETVRKKKFIRYNRTSTLKRIGTWFIFTIQTFINLLFERRNTELFIVTNPPFVPFLGYFFNRLRGTNYHLLIYDIYPDALVHFDKAKKGAFIERMWSKLNKHLFKNATTIFTLSNNMGSLIKSYYSAAAVHIIPNWADTSLIKPVEKSGNPFAKQYDQVNKITVTYSGNMGATHAIEKIADLAAALKHDQTFKFFAIGEGAKKSKLEKLKNYNQLDNLNLLPYQNKEMFPYILASADIGVVTLSAGAEDLSVPSKTYNLLAAGVALLVIASPKSELACIIDKYKCGVHFEEHETNKMINFLKQIKDDPEMLRQMKTNAREASFQFTPANAYKYKAQLNSNIYVSKLAETGM
ncbi:MAG: glycosyltransferase family 4 protein [Chitinophagaceae bacterium]